MEPDPTVPCVPGRLELWIARIGFITAMIGLVGAFVQLRAQSHAISEFRDAFQNSRTLRESLEKPLEGLWKFEVLYDQFHDEPQIDSGRKVMYGQAIFLWEEGNGSFGYRVFVGGGIKTINPNGPTIVAGMSKHKLQTDDSSGLPGAKFTMKGEYLVRVSASPNSAYQNPSDKDKFVYTEGLLEYNTSGRVIEITMKYESARSVGEVKFSRD